MIAEMKLVRAKLVRIDNAVRSDMMVQSPQRTTC
jgi:hypothetical protein